MSSPNDEVREKLEELVDMHGATSVVESLICVCADKAIEDPNNKHAWEEVGWILHDAATKLE
jgi:hypothetical protein